MLYGIRPALARALVDAGYRVRIYVPVGEGWWKYFRRRLREGKRTQLIAMFARNFFRKSIY
jgi:proline dehydrogenase